MFGNNAITSTWGQPNNNNQQQQGTSAFGQPANSAFGGGGAFGSGGAFGQPQQQQQTPAANPMFGSFGTPAANTSQPGTSGFGAFGQNNASTTGAFGAKPATGFGAFGGTGTSTFGSGGAFGNTTAPQPAATGVFGQPSTSTGAFGGGGSLFGTNKPATTFGTTAADTVAPVTTGSSNPPYSVYSEKDTANASITLQYQSISCMPAYRGSSFEELRVQDYQQGRKTANATVGTGFGQPATGAFGQQSTSGGIFGQPAQSTTANNAFGAFGSNTTATPATGGFGAFGQQNNASQPANTGGGLFGAFGQQQQPQNPQPSAFGAFGQANQQPAATGTSGGLFGGGSAFGQQNKPAFGAFGANNTTTSAFGQPTQSQQPTTTGLFGQQQPQQNTTGSAFSAFGSNNNQPKPSLFGQPAQQPAQQSTGFGLFGQQNQQNQQQSGQPATGGLFGGGTTGGGLFGQNSQQQQQPSQPQTGGLFGNTQPAQQPATGGLFGGGTTGGLFGNTQQQNQQQPTQTSAFGGGGLFGTKPATTTPTTGGLFGGLGQNNTATNTQTSTGLFGSTFGQNNAQQNNTGSTLSGGLFGTKPAAPAFGTASSTGQATGGSLFGSTLGGTGNTFNASATAPGAQGSLTASIAQPIGASLPVFSMLPPGPRAVPLDQPKKKAGFFTDVPTRSPVPRLQLGFTPASTKLRGFASTAGGGNLGSSLAYSTTKSDALNLTRSASPNKGIPGPDVFLNGGGTSGSNGRQSVKKLVLNKKIEPAHLLGRAGSPGLATAGGKTSFSPVLGIAARQKEAEAASTTPKPETPEPTPSSTRPKPSDGDASSADPKTADLQEGEYWCKPDLATLRTISYHELRAFKGLVVGRVGYGQIEFLAPVDLTGVPRLDALFGDLILFEDAECAVYPNSDEADKPPPGEGLNVPARITLWKCWPLDKSTQEPIKDKNHPAAIKFQKRLAKRKHIKHEHWDLEEGKWVFRVESF
ncbi:hypothetical protein PUNSTDRAFT_119779 [Punctularia strigosozonata HHB-11173 SS5]|uniref:uncharacterized protein n=1 Tax=Punctularia strigosozonata (strain HHB-11173) TaxID=741275 RepID=UPI0004418318|nr:uncharacterized protein PUNSTDRAFT_119779 [Punctularia strigosozonata HHB-11173 SS5]EIN10946.1 hypothetical protein PUNSTDRAFT_119779 [Punctularia strigosozonata HHB-11173 SS5]